MRKQARRRPPCAPRAQPSSARPSLWEAVRAAAAARRCSGGGHGPGDSGEAGRQPTRRRLRARSRPHRRSGDADGGAASSPDLRLRRRVPACQAGEPAATTARVQLTVAGPGGTGVAEAPASVQTTLRSPGQPLDAATRAFMEPAFGHDFSDVRVHASTERRAIGSRRGCSCLHGREQYRVWRRKICAGDARRTQAAVTRAGPRRAAGSSRRAPATPAGTCGVPARV